MLVSMTIFPFSLSLAAAQTDKDAQRVQLENELIDVQKEIQLTEHYLDQKHQETQSLQRDVDILSAQIHKAQLEIQEHNLAIGNLTGDIATKEEIVAQLQSNIDEERDSLAELLRRYNEASSYSMAEAMLSSESLSDFFSNVDSYESIKVAIRNSLDQLRSAQSAAEKEKSELAVQRAAEADAKYAIQQEKDTVEAKQDEKENLVAISKSEEETYQEHIAEKQARAAQIKAALFSLRDTGAIQFGDALKFAQEASAQTGVRPAFILAILQQESNLGQNVGTCNRAGDPPEKSWRNIMNPTRDQGIYLQVVNELGLDPDTTPLSCPQGGGWGGAMGPSQFIPSTWVMYAGRIESALGVAVADPWKPEHAFMATALFLADLGAGRGGYSAEREAAARYYAGGGWATRGLGYADSVLSRAQNIQTTMIDPLQGI
jgi:peptidoglycan hydrolase CwlO-like protein